MKKTILLVCILGLAACENPGQEALEPVANGQDYLVSFDARVDTLLAKMTLEEKVGQMTQPDQEFFESEDDIRDYMLGSVLSGGGSDPETNSFEDWRDMYERYQAKALETRLKIPILYGVDAVHGHSNVIGAVIFPHNIGLGATRNPQLVEEIGRVAALEIQATGINWTFAPCLAVPRDDRWGRTYEGFSESPDVVAALGGAAVRGLQGTDLAYPNRVVACAKHFAGDGGTSIGTGVRRGDTALLDQGDTQLTEAELRRIHIDGYRTSIDAGVATIMPSYSSWNGEKASGSHRLLTEILKEELGFEGFVVSDFRAIDQLPGDYKSDVVQSINAGMDMVMVPDRYKLFFNTTIEAVNEGLIPMERIDDAVRRILRVKFAAGLFEPDWSPKADPSLAASFGSEEHRAVARQAVRESMVLLKNQAEVLPLRKDAARIHVVGPGANDIGIQSGGWTIQWQGEVGAITEGTTILEAITAAVGPDTQVTSSVDGSGAEGADVVVVVVAERPYAEMLGDTETLTLPDEDLQAFATAKAAGIPVVTVVVSGRPVILGDLLEQSDAVMAAFLPGTEGDGVADVLFGDHAPTGKLGFSWPRSVDQEPINVGDAEYDPLFPFGFGLTY